MTNTSRKQTRKQTISWAFYDWANSAFATTIIGVFFPAFLSDFWLTEGGPESTGVVGYANALAGLLVALSAPVLGAIADAGGARKKFLAVFATLGIASSASLAFVGQGDWLMAAGLYVLAFVGFAGGNVYYDSMLTDVASAEQSDQVSSLGYALGYLGGGTLFAINAWMVNSPETFGLDGAVAAVRASFITVGLWWFVFSLPLFFFVRQRKTVAVPYGEAVRGGLKQLAETMREIRALRVVFLFLIAYWLYIDGVHTIIVMATDYGKRLGFETANMMTAFLITQFVGFPSALLIGWLASKRGAKPMILIALAVYIGIAFYGMVMETIREFYIMAGIIGAVQGGIQALSRSFYSRLIPADKAAEFFGFYNMVGKFAAIIGPALVATVSAATGNPRIAIFAITILFIIGGAFLLRVPEPRGKSATEHG